MMYFMQYHFPVSATGEKGHSQLRGVSLKMDLYNPHISIKDQEGKSRRSNSVFIWPSDVHNSEDQQLRAPNDCYFLATAVNHALFVNALPVHTERHIRVCVRVCVCICVATENKWRRKSRVKIFEMFTWKKNLAFKKGILSTKTTTTKEYGRIY